MMNLFNKLKKYTAFWFVVILSVLCAILYLGFTYPDEMGWGMIISGSLTIIHKFAELTVMRFRG